MQPVPGLGVGSPMDVSPDPPGAMGSRIDPERVLVLAPLGRDSAAGWLEQSGMASAVCPDLPALVRALNQGAGLALLTQEAVRETDLQPLAGWIAAQPPWSDLPFIVLTESGGGPERNPAALRLMETLGNVSLLERPFHPATLVSLARTGLRSRQRQYQARAQLERLAYQGAALRESESRFRLLADNIPVLAWTAHADGSIFWYNSRWYAYTGTTPEQMMGWGWQSVHDPATLPTVTERWKHALANGARFEMVFPLRGADGVFRPFLTQVVPVRDPGGSITRWFGTNVDISAERAAEAELRRHRERLQEMVAERTAELAEALDRLQAEIAERQRTEAVLRQAQKMEAIGQLTGGIAHDFNNLLTGIGGSLELMQTRIREGRTGELGRYIDAASDSARRAASLTHRLLAFARRQTLERKPVQVNNLAAGMEELIRRTVGPVIEVELVFDGGLWTTLCDANQLESALLNLCINARDAMPEGGRLTIQTSNERLDEAYARAQQDVAPGQYVALSVTDTGSGMSPETASNAFDPFFTTKPIGQGTGLGLSMVYGFVKQSEGHVRLHTELGRGTTLRMYLPRHHEAADGAAMPAAPAAEPPPAPAHATVLVVEDEDAIRAMIVETLEDLGYRAIEASDGPGGLRAIQSGAPIDLLLTDVGLPGMNGRQLADTARELRPDLKVLFITGYIHDPALGNGLLEAKMQMVSKPFTLDALAAKIREMIEA